MASSRRHMLMGMAALLAGQPLARAWAQSPSTGTGLRTATLDWALFETLLAIGANVVAAPELLQFREIAVEPPVPESVVDLGLRGTPNFEILRQAEPELIFSSNYYGWADPQMRSIAPIESHSIYLPGESPFALADKAMRAIGTRLSLPGANTADAAQQRLEDCRKRLAASDGRPVLLANLGDSRHYRVFGADSMFGDVLTRLGRTNAWTSATNYSAMATVGLETLASMPDAWIVLIPPHPADTLVTLSKSAFWNALPAVREGRVLTLGAVDPYGGLPAAIRFANLLTEGLDHARNG